MNLCWTETDGDKTFLYIGDMQVEITRAETDEARRVDCYKCPVTSCPAPYKCLHYQTVLANIALKKFGYELALDIDE